jgi:hypothetical protein
LGLEGSGSTKKLIWLGFEGSLVVVVVVVVHAAGGRPLSMTRVLVFGETNSATDSSWAGASVSPTAWWAAWYHVICNSLRYSRKPTNLIIYNAYWEKSYSSPVSMHLFVELTPKCSGPPVSENHLLNQNILWMDAKKKAHTNTWLWSCMCGSHNVATPLKSSKKKNILWMDSG